MNKATYLDQNFVDSFAGYNFEEDGKMLTGTGSHATAGTISDRREPWLSITAGAEDNPAQGWGWLRKVPLPTAVTTKTIEYDFVGDGADDDDDNVTSATRSMMLQRCLQQQQPATVVPKGASGSQ